MSDHAAEGARSRSDDEKTKGDGPLGFLRLEPGRRRVAEWVAVSASIWLLVTAVGAMGTGFQAASGDWAEQLFEFASNPFIGLMIGILATAITQSSSTTTSLTVAMVGGGMPVSVAIPILLGANVGTTMTSSVVALTMAGDRDSFRRAYAAASVHDMYNLLGVAIFLPLELAFGLLESMSHWLAQTMAGTDGGPVASAFAMLENAVDFVTAPGVELLEWAVSPLGETTGGLVLMVAGILLIIAMINLTARLMKSLLVGRVETATKKAIGHGPVSGVASGTLFTMLVQSSTTTTSLAVPLAASGKFSLREIFPFTVGGNVGTTLTAIIAALASGSGDIGTRALQAAFVHLLYNLLCALLILGVPMLRTLPPRGAEWLAGLAVRSRAYVVGWIGMIFFALPAAMIFLTR